MRGFAIVLHAQKKQRRMDPDIDEERIVELLSKRNSLMHSAESIERGRSFRPRDSDVFIVTYPKCGTTWVTAIAHALRSRCDPSHQTFSEITEVVPWDILALDCGQDLDADQVCSPRLFKSHESFEHVAKGGKYVYVCRNPEDAFVSFYNFLPKYMHCEGIGVETFAKAIFGGLSHSGGLWSHLVSWICAARSFPENVLVVTYEDLKRDPKREIERIFDFAFASASEDLDRKKLITQTEAITSFEYMSSHQNQFDDNFVFGHIKKQIGLGDDQPLKATKVRKGAVGSSKTELPPKVRDMLRTRWENTVDSALGTKSYEDMVRDIIHAELQQS